MTLILLCHMGSTYNYDIHVNKLSMAFTV